MSPAATFVILLCAALVPGVLALQLAMRHAPSFDAAKRVLVPLAYTLYGYLPAGAITVGLAPQSATTALGAIGFFLIFSVAANVILHGAIARAHVHRQAS